MQLQTIRDEARGRIGIANTDALAADADMTPLVNAAYRQISTMRDWDWMTAEETIAVTADDDEYTVAADWRATLYVGRQIDTQYPDGYVPLERAQRRDLREQSAYAGIPAYWMVESGVLRISPVPSEAWTLLHVYLKQITALSGDTDEPFIPDDYIDLLIVKTAKMLAVRTGNRDQMSMLRDEEMDLMQSLSDEVYRARGAVLPRTRRDTSWGG